VAGSDEGRFICCLLYQVLLKGSCILKVQIDFVREYDVPYHVRAAIDLKIFVVSEIHVTHMEKYKLNLILERLLALSANSC